jgi:[ribosomal protein S5]-alanine N-acetyltransferase
MLVTPTALWRNDKVELMLLDESHISPAYVDWLNDPEVNRYLESRFARHTLESTQRFVRDCRDSSHSLMLGICSFALGGRHVGNIKIGPIDTHHGLGEVGIMIGDRAAWGRGVASAAIDAMAAIARDELALRKITAGCYGGNVGSQRAFLRAGFVVEAVRPRHFIHDELECDLVLMSRHLCTPIAASTN